MKTLRLAAVAALALLAACSGDSSTQILSSEVSESTSTSTQNPFEPVQSDADIANPVIDNSAGDDVNTFKGEIGVIVDARQIARKGYKPRSAVVTVTDSLESVVPSQPIEITRTLALGEFSHMGVFKLALSELEPGVADALNNGAELSISLFETMDASSANAIVEDYSVSRVVMQANPNPVTVSANAVEETDLEFTLTPDTEYFIEHVNWKGDPTGYGMRFQTPAGRNIFVHNAGIPIDDAQSTNSNKWLYRFYPIPGEENTYAIQYKDTGQFLRTWNNFFHLNAGHETWSRGGRHNPIRLAQETDFNQALSQHGDWIKFEVKKVRDGVFTLNSKMKGTPLMRIDDGNHYWGLSFGTNDTNSPSVFKYRSYKMVLGQWQDRGNPGQIPMTSVYFRFVTNNVDWELESIGSEMVQTVVPEPRIGIAYETDEDNCGSENLITTTGVDRSAETSVGAEFQESFSLMTSQSNTLGWKLGVSLGGSPGPSYSAEISGSHTWESQNSQTTTTTSVETSTETIAFSSTKQVTVRPDHNSRVTAAYEVYDDIKAQFVQRFQLRGMDKHTGAYLSGDEIATQLQFTNFPGVVTGVSSDVTEFTLHGTATISNLIKGRTTITEKEIECL